MSTMQQLSQKRAKQSADVQALVGGGKRNLYGPRIRKYRRMGC
ncbi:hypothetical protein BTH41_01010 [Bacillus mycoides]|nr:hypothetical protein BTH41_01010 [Bacillus mycoides]